MSQKGSRFGWVVGIIVSFAMFAGSYAQYQLSPVASQLMVDLGLSAAQFSSIFSASMIPSIFLSLICGIIADKFGIKSLITVGLILSTLGAFLRLGATGFGLMFVCMLLLGVTSTFCNANAAKIFGGWFPPEKIGVMMGIYLAASTLGQTVAMATTALLPNIGSAYMITAIMHVVASLLWIFIVRNPKSGGTDQVAKPAIPFSACLKIVLKSRGVWLTGLCLMFTLGPFIILSSFLPSALLKRGIGTATAGVYGSAITVGCMCGCLLGPPIAAKVGKNKPVLLLVSLLAALGSVFGWQAPHGAILALCIFVTGFAQGCVLPVAMSVPIRLPEVGPVYAGTAGGFTSTLHSLVRWLSLRTSRFQLRATICIFCLSLAVFVWV